MADPSKYITTNKRKTHHLIFELGINIHRERLIQLSSSFLDYGFNYSTHFYYLIF